jgi:hypothetical protein
VSVPAPISNVEEDNLEALLEEILEDDPEFQTAENEFRRAFENGDVADDDDGCDDAFARFVEQADIPAADIDAIRQHEATCIREAASRVEHDALDIAVSEATSVELGTSSSVAVQDVSKLVAEEVQEELLFKAHADTGLLESFSAKQTKCLGLDAGGLQEALQRWGSEVNENAHALLWGMQANESGELADGGCSVVVLAGGEVSR